METLCAGRILTPKRPIAANRYWIGLLLASPEHNQDGDSRSNANFAVIDLTAVSPSLCAAETAGICAVRLSVSGRAMKCPRKGGEAQAVGCGQCIFRSVTWGRVGCFTIRIFEKRRHTRTQNLDTVWPIVAHDFLH